MGEEKKITKMMIMLKLLQEHHKVSVANLIESLTSTPLGITNIIYNLRKQGHNISSSNGEVTLSDQPLVVKTAKRRVRKTKKSNTKRALPGSPDTVHNRVLAAIRQDPSHATLDHLAKALNVNRQSIHSALSQLRRRSGVPVERLENGVYVVGTVAPAKPRPARTAKKATAIPVVKPMAKDFPDDMDEIIGIMPKEARGDFYDALKKSNIYKALALEYLVAYRKVLSLRAKIGKGA